MTTTDAPRTIKPPPPHHPALDHARKVGTWAVRALALDDAQRRATAGLAMHDQVLEHHVAIVALGERNLFGPMLTLLRPMVDRYLRGLWIARSPTPATVTRMLASHDAPDTATLLHLLRKTRRLGDADAMLRSWEDSPLYVFPIRIASDDPARAAADGQFVPTLGDVVDGLNYASALTLLSVLRMAEMQDDWSVAQSARWRLSVMGRFDDAPAAG